MFYARWRIGVGIGILGCILAITAPLTGDEPTAKPDKTNASRLKAVREVLEQIHLAPADPDSNLDVAIQPNPLLRYNDVSRGIADSTIWRVGAKGRPVALISAELYGRDGNVFLLNHEFLAVQAAKVKASRDVFKWQPPVAAVEFQTLKTDLQPAANPALRLAQLRRLAEEFSVTQLFGQSKIVLRRLPTPIDRYVPAEKPNADGAIFAYVWGVNPEAIVFIETDGIEWSYAFARLSSAPIWAERGDAVVWKIPQALEHEHPTASYTSIHRRITVPAYIDDESE